MYTGYFAEKDMKIILCPSKEKFEGLSRGDIRDAEFIAYCHKDVASEQKRYIPRLRDLNLYYVVKNRLNIDYYVIETNSLIHYGFMKKCLGLK